jgi:hypothetical protein
MVGKQHTGFQKIRKAVEEYNVMPIYLIFQKRQTQERQIRKDSIVDADPSRNDAPPRDERRRDDFRSQPYRGGGRPRGGRDDYRERGYDRRR